MSSPDVFAASLLQKREPAPGIFDFTLSCRNGISFLPGQFVNFLVPEKSLRRPISICDAGDGFFRVLFRVAGEGTKILSGFCVGDTLSVLGPLGNGFPQELYLTGRPLILGGGIGVPPMLYLLKKCREKTVCALGFRDREQAILLSEFEREAEKCIVVTEDGSLGEKGYVTAHVKEENFTSVLACGPFMMLRAAHALAKEKGVPAYVSVEERMACGVGACLGCAVPMKDGSYRRACADGPVFDADLLAL